MAPRSRRRPLAAGELAEAALLADLAVVLTVAGQIVPLGGALIALAAVPLAVAASRHRLRAVVAGSIAASFVGFLVIGTAALWTMAACTVLGAWVGASDRRGRSHRRTIVLGSVVLWPPVSIFVVGMMGVLSSLRELMLDQIRNGAKGSLRILEAAGARESAARTEEIVTWATDHWWVTAPVLMALLVPLALWVATGLSTPTLRRVHRAFAPPSGGAPATDAEPDRAAPSGSAPVGPVPVELHSVAYRFPGRRRVALDPTSLRLEPGELVAVTGPNGAGKSTLARLVAGRLQPSAGTIARPGAAGLGAVGGTALIAQRPEAQVLGVRVADDVVWGLREPETVDIEAMLTAVGLAGFAGRETATLSGGELQRLAVAAALARRPGLLVSDESTAMLDHEGRRALDDLLHEVARGGTTVLHVTHDSAEAAAADRTVSLGPAPAAIRVTPDGRPRRWGAGGPILELRGVGYEYGPGTPWAHRALRGIDLVVERGESVVVVGRNGSGKSTLAWIASGLLAPTEGEALVGGTPAIAVVGRVAVSFQHARLQLLRPRVGEEIAAAAGIDSAVTGRVLAALGLDPAFARRRVDELSGGEARRVVLAAALAGRAEAIVLDEPFAGLDAAGRADLGALLLTLRDEHGVAIVIVTHDADLPAALVERTVELEAGRIVRDERAATEDPA